MAIPPTCVLPDLSYSIHVPQAFKASAASVEASKTWLFKARTGVGFPASLLACDAADTWLQCNPNVPQSKGVA
jgi:hypothetical protein